MNSSKKHIAIVCNPTFENNKALRIADRIITILKEKQISYALFTTHWPQDWHTITDA